MTRRIVLALLAVAALAIVPRTGAGSASGPAIARSLHPPAPRVSAVAAQQDDPAAPRTASPLTILQINDVYSTVPIDGAGGLARVATIKQRLVEQGRRPFMMLAGDFLSSSVASTVFRGEQMVAALNEAGLDMATLGNHEFDFGVDLLLQRMKEARWQWVVSNVIDTTTNKPIGGAAPYVVRTFGTLKVGLIGLCLASESIPNDAAKRVRIVNPLEAAATYLPMIKRERVDVIVALTHLTFDEDRTLAERFPDIDLIIGGHEHFPIAAVENRTFISKAGSDAKFVARIDVERRRPSRAVERFYELIPVTGVIPDEPRTAAVVSAYEAKLGSELKTVIGTTRVPLDGDTARLRASETNLGNLVADAVRAYVKADAAIVNSGSIRGDRVHEPGSITRYDVIEVQPFRNVVCTVLVSGRLLLDALNHGVARLPAAAGQFPQVSGMTFRVERQQPAGNRVRDLKVQGQPVDLNRTYTLAIPDFILLGGDGYRMFAGQRVLVGPESGTLVSVALEQFVAAHETVAPTVEGRMAIEP
jgi:5'-nucleotidase / UDP-sugar diphosphatase